MWKTQYQEKLFSQLLPYLAWREQQEVTTKQDVIPGSYKIITFGTPIEESYQQLCDSYDFLVITGENGYLADTAVDAFAKCFFENPQTVVAYADEDYLGLLPDEIKKYFSDEGLENYQFEDTGFYPQEPWFKPEFSPDTLQSFFYFGNVVAIHLKRCKEKQLCEINSFSLQSIYDWVKQIPQDKKNFTHVSKVLFTNADIFDKDSLPGYHPEMNMFAQKELPMVSVVIPSKDHPEILNRCLSSLLEKTDYPHFECIIVDNGSNAANRQWITNRLLELEELYHKKFKYVYKEIPFNFSKMCNLGKDEAIGEYILLLNDDMEIISQDWLSIMVSQAMQPHTGAVGAKLYYPDSKLIQHAGITNMGIGPAHKLCGLTDDVNYYHGVNIVPYNMIAVTAACLLVKKEKYEEAGGMDEELSIAYNDVEFCFKLYEKGYYNVVRNDVILYHHESLSRGQDDTAEKKQRLFLEKTRLYQKHPKLKATDPFYHKDLVQWKKDTEYHCNYAYPFDEIKKVSEVSEKFPKVFSNKYLRKLTGENLSMLQIDGIEEEEELTISGWHVIKQMDNRCMKKYLILFHKESGKLYQTSIDGVLRPDVENLFAGDRKTKGAVLAGFCVKIDKNTLPAGEYEIGVLTTNIPRSWRNMIYQGGKIWTRSLAVLKRN